MRCIAARSSPAMRCPPSATSRRGSTMSRVTVRKAVQHLVRDGVLVQRHGSGTYRRPAAQPRRAIASPADLVHRGHGAPRHGGALGLARSRPLSAVARGDRDARACRRATASPASRACAFPATRRSPSSARRCRPASCPIPRRLERRSMRISKSAATGPVRAIQRIRAVSLGEEDADLLEVAPGRRQPPHRAHLLSGVGPRRRIHPLDLSRRHL